MAGEVDAVIDHEVRKPRLASIGTALGAHRYSQEELIEGFRGLWNGKDREFARFERFHRAVRVESRHLSLPMEAYPLQSFDEATRVFLKVGTDLEQATLEALADIGLAPTDVDALFFTTVTGVAAPTLDVRLANRVRFARM
jgi:alkylresorcinol/alkylpyrone synthase